MEKKQYCTFYGRSFDRLLGVTIVRDLCPVYQALRTSFEAAGSHGSQYAGLFSWLIQLRDQGVYTVTAVL